MNTADIKEMVKEKYGQAALRVKAGGSSCCGATASSGCCDPITSNLYDAAQAGQIPEEAMLASFGCGNPTALAKLNLGHLFGVDGLVSSAALRVQELKQLLKCIGAGGVSEEHAFALNPD